MFLGPSTCCLACRCHLNLSSWDVSFPTCRLGFVLGISPVLEMIVFSLEHVIVSPFYPVLLFLPYLQIKSVFTVHLLLKLLSINEGPRLERPGLTILFCKEQFLTSAFIYGSLRNPLPEIRSYTGQSKGHQVWLDGHLLGLEIHEASAMSQ